MITGDDSKSDQILLVKVGKYIGFLCIPWVLITMVPRNTRPTLFIHVVVDVPID